MLAEGVATVTADAGETLLVVGINLIILVVGIAGLLWAAERLGGGK